MSPTMPSCAGAIRLIAEALLASASPQVRNMATIGGNLLQRTRCGYFRDAGSRLQQARARLRLPGDPRRQPPASRSSAAAMHCIATHPSDLAVALAALDAAVELRGARRRRSVVPVNEFYLLPGDTPRARDGDACRASSSPRSWCRRAGAGAALALPQGARPRLVRVRAGLGRGRRRASTAAASARRASRWAASAPSRGGCPRSKRRSPAAPATPDAILPRPRHMPPTAPGRCRENGFKIPLMQRALIARAADRRRREEDER